ncbi:MAG: NAD(P)-dependent oxidoreductase [Bacteroidota bacterium]
MKKVLITDGVHPLLIQGLKQAGYDCDYRPAVSLDEVRQIIGDYNGLIVNSKILVDPYLLDKAPGLRFVGRLGSGMEIIDRAYAAQKGVAVHNSPEGNCNAVAEQALGMLLVLANNLLRADAEVRQQIWEREKNRGFELEGRTVGIVGFGHTGSSFAQKLNGFSVRILAYDKYKSGYADQLDGVEETDMEQIFAEADIISFHLPLTEETRHLVDADFLAACKPGLVLINTSRGAVVRTQDLLKALENGHLRGACLDVFENEKPHTFTKMEQQLYQRLYSLDNVVLSPHIAGWTKESKEKLASILLERILKEEAARIVV